MVDQAEREAQRIVQQGETWKQDQWIFGQETNMMQRESVSMSWLHLHFRHSCCTVRTKKVKDAKSEAQKEIEDYKKQKDEEFKSYEDEVRSLY